jgi:membrane-associated phospholipid phosphatase
MAGLNFMHAWISLLGSLTMIALILTAFGLMLGIVKSANAMKHLGAIIGIVIALILFPGILVNAWSSMSPWQQSGIVATAIAVWQWLRPRQRTRKTTHD